MSQNGYVCWGSTEYLKANLTDLMISRSAGLVLQCHTWPQNLSRSPDRRGSPCSAGCTTNQSSRPILMPFRGATKSPARLPSPKRLCHYALFFNTWSSGDPDVQNNRYPIMQKNTILQGGFCRQRHDTETQILKNDDPASPKLDFRTRTQISRPGQEIPASLGLGSRYRPSGERPLRKNDHKTPKTTETNGPCPGLRSFFISSLTVFSANVLCATNAPA